MSTPINKKKRMNALMGKLVGAMGAAMSMGLVVLSAGLTGLALLAGQPAVAAGADLFAPYTATPTGSWPEVVAIGDLNGDGRNDVALVTSYYFDPVNDYTLFVFLQDDAGGLLPPVKYPTAGTYVGRASGIAIGDVNHDGLADVVIGNNGTSIEIFTQNPSGELNPSVLYFTEFSTWVRIADMNHDGLQDVVGIGWGGSVGVFLQNGSGTLDAAVTYAAPHLGNEDLELGDVNGDGLIDIVVMLSGLGFGGNIQVLTQKSDGTMNAAVEYDLGGFLYARGVTIGDFNGDGRNDVAVTNAGNRPSAAMAVFFQKQSGKLDTPVSYESDDIPEPIQSADVNQDCRDDLVVLHGGFNTMGVYLQQQNGLLGAEQYYSLPYATHYKPQGLAVGDFTGDGFPDVAIADYNHGLVVLHNNVLSPPPDNAPPVANAGEDQTAQWHDTITLDGSGSTDSDGLIVSYSWRQLAGEHVKLHATDNPAVVSFKAPDGDSLLFKLTVTDDGGATACDKLQVLLFK